MKKLSGLIQIPPKMLTIMSRWLTTQFSREFIYLFETTSTETQRTREWENIYNIWNKRIKGSGSSFTEIDIDLSGWKYSSSVKEGNIDQYFPRGIFLELGDTEGSGGSWNPVEGLLHIGFPEKEVEKVRLFLLQGKYKEASSYFERTILLGKLRTLNHEATHMAQTFLEVGIRGGISEVGFERRPSPGMPSRKIMNPGITQHSTGKLPLKYEKILRELEKKTGLENHQLDDTLHDLDDAEFYTKLRDEITKFSRDPKNLPKKESAMIHIKASSWFNTLHRVSLNKWKKAVKEFTKVVL